MSSSIIALNYPASGSTPLPYPSMAEPRGFIFGVTMAKVAVLVDLSFFLKRYNRLQRRRGSKLHSPARVAKNVWDTAIQHVDRKLDELYRILVYDCRPLEKKVHNPISGRSIDFAKSDQAMFRRALCAQLKQKRKLAVRLGDLRDGKRWQFHERAGKRLLSGKAGVSDLDETDVYYDLKQKGVDMKIGIDIASLAFKKLVDRIVLITGDADFVPAAKLARREGIDVVLDPLWSPISPDFHEHIDGLHSVWSKPTGLRQVKQAK